MLASSILCDVYRYVYVHEDDVIQIILNQFRSRLSHNLVLAFKVGLLCIN